MTGLTEAVLAALATHPGIAARPLVAILREAGHEVTKSELNATLYRALEEGVVVREGDAPPQWSLAATVAGESIATHVTDPAWIIDRWLERTGESWSAAQRRAALEGPRVTALAGFTEDELERALADAAIGALTWDSWQAAVVAVRSGSIRL